MVVGHNQKPTSGLGEVSSSVISSAISEVEKENILSRQNDPNAFDGRGSADVALGVTNKDLDDSSRG